MASTLALTVTQQPATVPPSIRITVTETGSPSVGTVTVQRTDPDGTTSPVRTTDGAPLPLSGGIANVTDYELPYGYTVTYRVAAGNNPSTTARLDVPDVWLTAIGVPSQSQQIQLVRMASRQRAANRGLMQPIGRKNPIAISDGVRSGASGDLVVRTITDAQRRALDRLLDDSQVLLLNIPSVKDFGVDPCYVSIGETQEDRVMRFGAEQRREWTLPYQIVDRPGGGSRAQYIYADLSAQYATYAAIPAGTTYAQLSAGT